MRDKIAFRGKILMLGYGGVAKCTLPLLIRHLDLPLGNITVMDMVDQRGALKDLLAQGVQFLQEKLSQETMDAQLSSLVSAGDIIVDLAWNIAATDILDWCHRHDVLYMNTSVELWDPYAGRENGDPCEQTLYVRHMAIRELMRTWKGKAGPTAIVEHGANPGLVSHFAKVALLDIGERLRAEKPKDPRRTAIDEAMFYGNFPELGNLLNVQVIHISEIDTQLTETPHNPDVFLNTWSVEGFFEEGTAPAEMGWGTHEKAMPMDAKTHASGPQNQICLKRFGMNTFVKSRVPSQETVGMVVRHGESFTLSDSLTLWKADGTAAYRPTVHYAYCPCTESIRCLEEVRRKEYAAPKEWRVMADEISPGGIDELGVLLMGHDFKCWWTGTVLGVDEARSLVPGQNATTLQVAASVLAAVVWMIRNPRKGVNVPDQLPHREILEVASPYLGTIPSIPIDWTPTGKPPDADTWQFQNFLTDERPHGKIFHRDMPEIYPAEKELVKSL